MSDIEEALKFDPGPAVEQAEDDEIAQALKFDPGPAVGGTFGEREKPGPGYPTPAAPFPEVPGAYEAYTNPTEPGASPMAMIKAGYVDDPVTKVKIYAKARGIPLRDIARNYRFAKGGEIEFKTPAGKWQREVSEHPGQQAKRMALQTASNPAVVLGTAGAMVAGGPGAVGGAMAGEGIRKSVGKFAFDEPQTAWGNAGDIALEGLLALGGESVAKLITGQTNKFLMRKSKSLRFAGKEISQGMLTPADHAKALYIEALANKHGIKLQAHQLYDREGMTNIWMYLRKHPLTANKVQEFDRALESQTDEALDGFIKEMGGYDQTPFKMGEELRDASGEAIQKLEDARQSTSQPYYDKAFDTTPTIDKDRLVSELELNKKSIARAQTQTPDIELMAAELKKAQPMSSAHMKQKGEDAAGYLARVSKDYKRVTGKDTPTTRGGAADANIKGFEKRNAEIENVLAGGSAGDSYVPTKIFQVDATDAITEVDRLMAETVPGDPSYTALKRVKKMLDAANGDARKLDRIKRSGIDNVLSKTQTNRTMSREMALVKKQLTDAMDDQIPDYSAARGVYGQWGMAKPIEEMKNSVIGELSRLEGHKELSTAVQRIFNVKNIPSADKMAQARKAIMDQDPGLWDRAIGQYIKDIYFDLTVTEGGTVVNSAGKMHKRLFGNKARRESMAAAFGGADTEGYKNLKDLMTVLQRASIGRGSQSMTAPFQQIEKELAGQMVTKAPEAFKHPWDFVVDKTFEAWNDILIAKRQGALMDALTRPDVVKKIQELKLLKPGSKKLIRGLTDLAALTTPQVPTEGDADYEGMTDAELMKLLGIENAGL